MSVSVSVKVFARCVRVWNTPCKNLHTHTHTHFVTLPTPTLAQIPKEDYSTTRWCRTRSVQQFIPVLAVVSNVLSHVCNVYMSSLSLRSVHLCKPARPLISPVESRYCHKTNDGRVFCFNYIPLTLLSYVSVSDVAPFLPPGEHLTRFSLAKFLH